MMISGSSYNTSSILTARFSPPPPPSSILYQRRWYQGFNRETLNYSNKWPHHHHHHHYNNQHIVRSRGEVGVKIVCSAVKKSDRSVKNEEAQDDNGGRGILQLLLWVAEGVYIVWLFLLPYAPGDPVWAISPDTVNSLMGLSLNFFFILPLMNSIVGIHLIEAPVIHPMSEGLFNFVIGWTFMFAPLLFTDRKRNRYKGSLDVLWGFQMFLTNTFLIPYMAIRLNAADAVSTSKEPSKLGAVMINGAPVVGLIGGAVCTLSILWACFGRMDGNFGPLTDRWEFLISYLGSDRLGYAFIWDICLYIIFQPWLIGDNLDNVEESKVDIVKKLRFLPVVGLVAYLLSLDPAKEL
ncbi:hypothetical protein BVC80_1211g76 [Macleaya cordata]|uniref:Transmembrane protein n=1 Tax=Macleaya cordata TaxID=56857 RepID=A0A200Q3H3_MACCD|nr:hypothetical protein BVC80_1211g76 [Macleaya cordata]